MNNRMWELAELCKDVGPNYHYYDPVFLADFTKLIVQECCEVAHCNFHVDGLTLAGILKEHFGVDR